MTGSHVRCDSPIARFLIGLFPKGIRGGGLIGASLISLMRVDPRARLHVGSHWLEIDLSYRTHFAAAISGTEFEPATARLIEALLKAGDTFFDVGANWGIFTILASKIVGNAGRVVAVEANPHTYARLLKSLRRHQTTNVVPLNFAVAASDGELVAIEKPWWRNDTAAYIGQSVERDRNANSAVSLTLDTVWALFGNPSVALFKLDVEGFEPLVLQGANAFLRDGLAGSAIIEISEWCKERCGFDWTQIYDLMEQAGFEATGMVDLAGDILPFSKRATGYVLFRRSTCRE